MDSLADEAVPIEPVSASKFPANREINRDLRIRGPRSAVLASNQSVSSIVCSQIPYAKEQGIFPERTGKYIEDHGRISRHIAAHVAFPSVDRCHRRHAIFWH